MQKVLILSDVHEPHADRRSQSLIIRFISDFKPDLLIVNGDLIDFYQLSPFDRDPARRMLLSDDITLANLYLDHLQKAMPRLSKKVFIEGNHEDRLRRYLWRQAPELYDVPGNTIQDMLHLEERKWGYVPYYNAVEESGAPGYEIGGILVMHGTYVRKASGASAKAHFERYHCSGVNGHTHRQGQYFFRAWGGDWTWAESGCMCSLEPPYSPSPDWQQGAIAGYIWDAQDCDGPRVELNFVTIRNGALSFGGKLYSE